MVSGIYDMVNPLADVFVRNVWRRSCPSLFVYPFGSARALPVSGPRPWFRRHRAPVKSGIGVLDCETSIWRPLVDSCQVMPRYAGTVRKAPPVALLRRGFCHTRGSSSAVWSHPGRCSLIHADPPHPWIRGASCFLGAGGWRPTRSDLGFDVKWPVRRYALGGCCTRVRPETSGSPCRGISCMRWR